MKKLPRDIVWDGSHATDVALTAIADAQEAVVDADVVEHVDSCDACARRLGEAALLSAAVGEAVGRVVPARSARARMAVSPARALAAGMVALALAALPIAPEMGRYARYVGALITRGLPVLARSGADVAASEAVARVLPAATVGASLVLFVVGWMIARARLGANPRARSAS